MASLFDSIIKETKAAFIIAKDDGVLDCGEVIQIAINLSQKIQKINNLSGSEKKALLLLTLKKGLDASGGVANLPGFADASPEVKKAFEDQLLSAASAAIDAVCMAFSGKLDLKKPANWMQCLPACLSTIATLVPKDQTQLKEAVDFAAKIVKTSPPETQAENGTVTQVSTTEVEVVTSKAESGSETGEKQLPGAATS
jgi:hypothetical protein